MGKRTGLWKGNSFFGMISEKKHEATVRTTVFERYIALVAWGYKATATWGTPPFQSQYPFLACHTERIRKTWFEHWIFSYWLMWAPFFLMVVWSSLSLICVYTHRIHVCHIWNIYIYMVTCTINIPPMLVYIPYMDPMGYIYIYI